MITRESVELDYSKIKSYAEVAMHKNCYIDAIKLISTAAQLAYHLNFRYTDDDFENMLCSISKEIIPKSKMEIIKGRFAFYDSFGMDSRGLTQQYIRALISWDVEFLYIIENSGINAIDIFAELKSYPKATIIIVPSGIDELEKAKFINKIVLSYKPEISFLHLAPWSISAMIAWNSVKGTRRYLVDLTDHAFWLGKSCSDYFIGFRAYGQHISSIYRSIPLSKQIRQQYYPIVTKTEFLGFDFDTTNKRIVFTGGTYYKMYGEKFIFFEILKRICNENEDVIIVIAGSGDSSPIEKFIKKHALSKKIFLIGNRKDINGVFKNIDIYLNTFPIIGGLMSQFAIVNNKPMIGFTTKDIPCNFSESLFVNNELSCPRFTYTDIDEFYDAINLLINSRDACSDMVSKYEGLVIDERTFSHELYRKVLTQETNADKLIVDKDICFDLNRFSDLYLSMENDHLHTYNKIKLSNLRFTYFKYSAKDFLFSLIGFLQSHLSAKLGRFL